MSRCCRADHQNKPDVAVSLAREWFDQRGVDIIMDVAATSCALALASIVKEKNKIMIATSTASSDVTGKACTPNSMHWVFDTYMEAKSTGGAMVKAGGDTWYFITPNYAFGEATQRDTTRFVEAGGGKVLGSQLYPFPETTDFSAFLVKAQASGAKILGICGAGADLINIIKQAHEFGLSRTMNLAAMVAYTTDMRSVGIEMAAGTRLSETYYWDLNDRTRSFQKRIQPKVTLWPNMAQAGNYSCTLHYLKTVKDMGAAQAKTDGAATVARMKAMPTDDDCFGPGKIREDGRKIHPAYLFEVKTAVGEQARVGSVQADRHHPGRGSVPAAVGQCLPDGESLTDRFASISVQGQVDADRTFSSWRCPVEERSLAWPGLVHRVSCASVDVADAAFQALAI